MFLEYLFIEFIEHLSPWKYHEIPDVYSPNGGMSHLLFLVTIRALHIYSSRRPIPSKFPKEPPSFFKTETSELVAIAIDISSPFSRRYHCIMSVASTANVPICQTIESDPRFFRIRRQLFELMVVDRIRWFQISDFRMLVLVQVGSCPAMRYSASDSTNLDCPDSTTSDSSSRESPSIIIHI